MGYRKATAAALPVIALLLSAPASPTGQGPAKPATGASVRAAGIEYDSEGTTMTSCRLRNSSGDRDVNVAMCDLMRDCIAGGATTPEQASTCFRPRIARLAAMVDAGLLQALEPDPPMLAEEAGDEIVVTGRRNPQPRPGLWTFKEQGTRQQINGDMGTLFNINYLPARVWQQCIKDGELAATLTQMLRESRQEFGGSGCGWDIKTITNGMFTGSQVCIRDRYWIKATMEGQQNGIAFIAYRRANLRALLANTTPGAIPGRSGAETSGMALRGGPAPGPMEFEEKTEINGNRVKDC